MVHASVDFLVISKNGASGGCPGCTDLAYDKAIKDGADVIDCSVQMSSDGVPFCSRSIDLSNSTMISPKHLSRNVQHLFLRLAQMVGYTLLVSHGLRSGT